MASPHRLLLALALPVLLAGCVQWRHWELGQPIVEAEIPRPEEGWTVR